MIAILKTEKLNTAWMSLQAIGFKFTSLRTSLKKNY